ncbi:MAG: ABC transporter permease [Candidatus Odyssella sp.]|nr:ABC transporter permease [Candidatus Odyssella sp.]
MSAGGIQKGHLRDRWDRFLASDIFYSYRRSPTTVIASIVTLVFVLGAVFAPVLAPHTPFVPSSIDINDAFKPPAWSEGGAWRYLLGTDNQGRDMLSTIMYGGRLSIFVGFAAVALAMVLGILLGLSAGYLGGWYEAAIMRVADVQLTIPPILLALLIDGVARAVLPPSHKEDYASLVLVVAIGLASWPPYARVVRGATLVEKSKDYVAAARVIGVPSLAIMLRHILPNVLGPVLVIATIGLALAIIAEATLSFLGVGLPPTSPSLGTLIRVGNDFLFSGEWWITLFPALALVILSLAVNLLGDWLRDALNPKLR